MSRSGYVDEMDDQWALIRWRGAVKSAIRGKRGQEFLKEMLLALDAIPDKCLIAHELETVDGVCALGAVGKQRGMLMNTIDPKDYEQVASAFSIPEALAREIMYENDEDLWANSTPQKRWQYMRNWVAEQIASQRSEENSGKTE